MRTCKGCGGRTGTWGWNWFLDRKEKARSGCLCEALREKQFGAQVLIKYLPYTQCRLSSVKNTKLTQNSTIFKKSRHTPIKWFSNNAWSMESCVKRYIRGYKFYERIQRKEKLMKAGSGGEGFWQEVEKKKIGRIWLAERSKNIAGLRNRIRKSMKSGR